jgi:hypothetical protein
MRLLMLFFVLAMAPFQAAAETYSWRSAPAAETLEQRFAPPPGFNREPAAAGSFAAWLRGLPMKPAGAPVNLFNGTLKLRQDIHAAVIDIDTGNRDLQQCADAIMRLRGEWLYGAGRASEIAFNYTSGRRVDFARWSQGNRPSADGRTWSTGAKADDTYASFKRYMTQVFAYAGTASLEKELKPVKTDGAPEIGDVFIKGGFPGHAVLVADVVRHTATGEARFLLIQSFMPAQDMHVLKQPGAGDVPPWYTASTDGALQTPEWPFPPGSHRRWP